MVINIWQHINDKAEQKTEQTEQKTELQRGYAL